MSLRRVVVFGPGPMFKGGMANYTSSLARAFDATGKVETHIVSWIQQYPAIIPRDFIDRASKQNVLEGTNIQVTYITDYNKPGTWAKTVEFLKNLNPEMVIFQWSVAVQGLPLGYIAERLRKESSIEVIFDCHFVIQKEQSALDAWFSKRGLQHAQTIIVHAQKTADELNILFPKKQFQLTELGHRTENKKATTVIKLFHPVYDMFKPKPDFDIAEEKQRLNLGKNVFLFFGFIRKYKGLHYCIEAFAKIAENNPDASLLIVGESFWNTLDNSKLSTKIKKAVFGFIKGLILSKKANEDDYNPLALIQKYGLENRVSVINDFVPNEEVYRYFQVSDAILLFYEYATPSGVESMAYNFKMPILASRVGHFPETVIEGYNGYLATDADTADMAKVMEKFLARPIPRDNVAKTAEVFSWSNYAKAILNK